MALHISRFSRNLANVSYLNTRRPYGLLEARYAKSNLISELPENGVPFRRDEDITIWARGIPSHDVWQLHSSIKKNSVVAWSAFEKYLINLCNRMEGSPRSEDTTNPGRPSPSQLDYIQDNLAERLPKLFVQPLEYKIFHPQLIFEDNVRGIKSVGVFAFIKQVAWLRTVGHWKFAYVKLDVLKITKHTEDGSVRVRWRIRGISMFKVVMALWKYKIWNIREALQDLDSWYDGFSTFYVGSDGLVFRHVVDKVTPDEDRTIADPKGPLGAKVALMLGLLPKDALSLGDLYVYSFDTRHVVIVPLQRLE